jgi:hypothetical protein
MCRLELTSAATTLILLHGNSPRLERIIAAERGKRPVSHLLAALETGHAETEFLLSAISVMELEHGWHRAQNVEIAEKRRRYLYEIFTVIPIEPFTRDGSASCSNRCRDEEKRVRHSHSRPLDRCDCPTLPLRNCDSQYSSLQGDSGSEGHHSLIKFTQPSA